MSETEQPEPIDPPVPAHTPADQPNAYGPAVTPVAQVTNPVVSITISDNGHAGFQIDSTLDGEVQPTMTFPESHGLVLATINTVEDWVGKLSERYPGIVPPEPPEPVEAPANVDVPYVEQQGETLTCTMGNWTGEPASYAYQWQSDGVDVVGGEATYAVTADDVGMTFTCVVTASNAGGSTAAPPSNGVVVTAA